jgi:hypothetical protein
VQIDPEAVHEGMQQAFQDIHRIVAYLDQWQDV